MDEDIDLPWLVPNPSHNYKRIDKYSKYNPPRDDTKDKLIKSKCVIPTKSSILVQSHGEKRIADFLYDNGIKFKYDKLLKLNEDNPEDKFFWVRPDFIIGKSIVIEYWGMKYNRANNPCYDQKAERKKGLYTQEGYFLIEVFAEQLEILDSYLSEKLREAGLKQF